MNQFYLVPPWFIGFDSTLELIFALITGLVALYSFKIYRISEQKETKLFGIGFLLISIGYVLKAMINFFVLDEAKDAIRGVTDMVSVHNLHYLGMIAAFSQVILFTAGLLTLVYMTLKVESPKIYSLLLATNLVVLALGSNMIIASSFLSALLLFYVCLHYKTEYCKNENPRTLWVMISFVGLLLAYIIFIFSNNFYSSYVAGHFLELGAYLLILASLLFAVRKNKK